MGCESEKLPFDSWTDFGKAIPAAQISHRDILRQRALVSIRRGFSPTTACCAVEPRFINTRGTGRDTLLNSWINWCNPESPLKTSKQQTGRSGTGRVTGKREATFSPFHADSDDVVPKSASRTSSRDLPEARLWTASHLLQAAIENLARIAPVETPLKIGLLDFHAWR